MNDPITLLYLAIAIIALMIDYFNDNDLDLPPPKRIMV